MNGLITILILVAAIATLGVLIVGVTSMMRGGEFNRKYGNKLMQWRVILQGSAVLLLVLLMLFGKD